MAIKTIIQKTIPSVDIDGLQFTQFNMSVSKKAGHKIAVSAKVHPYGKDTDGNRVYSGEELPISLPDVAEFIGNLDTSDQADCAVAIQKINEGLGVLAEKTLNIEFVEYEA